MPEEPSGYRFLQSENWISKLGRMTAETVFPDERLRCPRNDGKPKTFTRQRVDDCLLTLSTRLSTHFVDNHQLGFQLNVQEIRTRTPPLSITIKKRDPYVGRAS